MPSAEGKYSELMREDIIYEKVCLSSHRDKVLKLLVELLGSSSKDLVISTLRLTHLLMLKYEWRVSFATEGGVKAVLSCMQEFPTFTHVQQLALAVSNTHTHTHTLCFFVSI